MMRAILPCLLAVACGGVTEEDLIALQEQVDDQATKLQELEQALEDAGAVDLNELQGSYDSLQSDHDGLASDVEDLTADLASLGNEVDGLGRGQQQLNSDLQALGERVATLEESFGNDYWFVSAAPSSTLSTSTSWSDIQDADLDISADKPGAIAVWGQVSGSTTCAHNIRLKIESNSGSWEDTSEEVDLVATTYASGAEATVFAIFAPGSGNYEVVLQSEKMSSSGSGSCTVQAYSIAAVQLAELM
jgi:outer membrane murein-binding lipoprotein Lpp